MTRLHTPEKNMDPNNSRSWRKISSVSQASLGRGTRRFLYAGLLIASLVPRGSAQSSNPEIVFISLDGAPAMGDPKARVAIVEFGDYQCPYCGIHANQTLPQIVTDYVKTGKVRYFFKDFPIEAIHPQAFKAAEAARCAGEQGKYWEMHDRLFKDQLIVVMKAAPEFALALGLDVPKFQQCMDSEIYAPQIRKDLQEGRKHNVPGTPEFYVGTLDPQGARMTVVTMLDGSRPYDAFQQALDHELSASEE